MWLSGEDGQEKGEGSGWKSDGESKESVEGSGVQIFKKPNGLKGNPERGDDRKGGRREPKTDTKEAEGQRAAHSQKYIKHIPAWAEKQHTPDTNNTNL